MWTLMVVAHVNRNIFSCVFFSAYISIVSFIWFYGWNLWAAIFRQFNRQLFSIIFFLIHFPFLARMLLLIWMVFVNRLMDVLRENVLHAYTDFRIGIRNRSNIKADCTRTGSIFQRWMEYVWLYCDRTRCHWIDCGRCPRFICVTFFSIGKWLRVFHRRMYAAAFFCTVFFFVNGEMFRLFYRCLSVSRFLSALGLFSSVCCLIWFEIASCSLLLPRTITDDSDIGNMFFPKITRFQCLEINRIDSMLPFFMWFIFIGIFFEWCEKPLYREKPELFAWKIVIIFIDRWPKALETSHWTGEKNRWEFWS